MQEKWYYKSGEGGLVRKLADGIITRISFGEWRWSGQRTTSLSTPSLQARWFLQKPEQVQGITAAIPPGRIGSPEEIVGAALLLASEAGGYTTGSVVVVDGGYTAI